MKSLPLHSSLGFAALLLALGAGCSTAPSVSAGLPSWNDGIAKAAIVDFVAAVTTPGSPDFVAPEDRIAVFDNDGTLWCEQPIYTQLAFALDRVKALAPQHPEWTTTEPFASVLRGDLAGVAHAGEAGLMQIVLATHADTTSSEFETLVSAWLGTARHPKFDRPFTELTYQPMVELLAYLRAHGFQTWIVSGGGVDFMRPWTRAAYGIPPQQVVGSLLETKYEVRDGLPVLVRQPKLAFIDDKSGKPVGIDRAIGKRPIAAFGNSDGDFEMLEWTTSGPGRRLGVLVHHDDAAREYAYDRDSSIGRLVRGLDEAAARGWVVVGMRDDWRSMFVAPR